MKIDGDNSCLLLLQVPKCFGLVQIFCARPKIYLHIVAVTNIFGQTKRWFAFSNIGFCAGTKVFEEALNAVKFLDWLKKFGPAQKILGPVKEQGIILIKPSRYMPTYLTKTTQNGTKDYLKYKLDFENIQWNLHTYLSWSPYDFTNFQSWSIFFYQIESCLFIRWGFFCRSNLMSLKNRENSELGNWATMLNDLLKN